MKFLGLYSYLFVALAFSQNIIQSNAYKILAIFPSMSRSHFIVGKLLMEELAAAGHNVTVLSPYPRSTPMANYTDLTVLGIHDQLPSVKNDFINFENLPFYRKFQILHDLGRAISNYTLHHETVQRFLNDSNEHFDLILQEAFLNEAMHGFAHHFNAPIVAISTLGSSIWTNYMVGNPAPLSYVSSFYLPFADVKTFGERVETIIYAIMEYFFHMFYYWSMQENIYNEIFVDPTKPALWDLHRNVSLVLINNHFTLNYPIPYVPNMIEIGGIQINRKTEQRLPGDLQKYLDDATDGAIYFSLGSNIASDGLSPQLRSAFLNTFAKLKQKVLWKWDDLNIDGLPKNVLIQKWFPQDEILRHPNTKLFISHGGLLSVTESVYSAVPLLGIPLFADQPMNMDKVVRSGIGLTLKLNEINENSFTNAVTEILSNKKYAENIKQLRSLYLDQPMTPLQTAIYWIDYVARHKGAPHLRSAAQNLNFFQYHSLDVFAFLIGIPILAIAVLLRVLKSILRKPKPVKVKRS